MWIIFVFLLRIVLTSGFSIVRKEICLLDGPEDYYLVDVGEVNLTLSDNYTLECTGSEPLHVCTWIPTTVR